MTFIVANRQQYPFWVRSAHASKAQAVDALPVEHDNPRNWAAYAMESCPDKHAEVMPATSRDLVDGVVLVVPVAPWACALNAPI